jgi:SNF2 family DNA or RNA helicase
VNIISKRIKYTKQKKTEIGAKKIFITLQKHPIAVVNVGTGGGKTFMSIRAIAAYKHNAHILVITTRKQVDSHDWPDSIDSYNQEVSEANLTYTVCTYGALNSKKQQLEIVKELLDHQDQPLYVIADEAHRIKNPSSKNFKHIQKLAQLHNHVGTICLTATPISESLLDARSYLILAGFYRNKTQFNKEHVTRYDEYFQPITKDRSGQIHNEWLKDYELIINRLKDIQVYVPTDDLLPKTIYKEINFEYDKDTQKAYRQIKKDYLNGVYESVAEANAAQRQFVAEHNEQRCASLSKIIDDPLRPSGPILIFYQYNAELDSLLDYLPNAHPDYKIFEINGRNKYDSTTVPPEKSLFLCQYVASGEALNAQWSHVSVFYAPTYSWEKFKQSRGRNVRAYQKGTTYHIRFVVLKTINEHYWYDLIDNKKAFTTNLMTEYLMKD